MESQIKLSARLTIVLADDTPRTKNELIERIRSNLHQLEPLISGLCRDGS